MKIRITMVFEIDWSEVPIQDARQDILEDPLDTVLEFTDKPVEVMVEEA